MQKGVQLLQGVLQWKDTNIADCYQSLLFMLLTEENSKFMKNYKWHLTISTRNNVCSQRQVPPQAKNTITLVQYNPQKLTPKNPDRKHRRT